MKGLRTFFRRLTGFWGRDRWEADLDAELRSNLALHADDNVRVGMSPEDARRAARLRFGSLDAAKEACRERRLLPPMADLARSLGYAARSLRASPGFGVAVIATLALSIGANATVLSALYALVLRPLPVEDPERLVQLVNLREARNPDNPYSESSWGQYADLRDRVDLFEGAALRSPAVRLVGRGGALDRVRGQQTSAEFFDLMGATPVLGRFFRPAEVDPGPGRVIVLAETWWESDFGADADVVGTEIALDAGVPYTVIGVAPRSMEAFDREARFTIPYDVDPRDRNPAGPRYQAHSDDLWLRLKPGVGPEVALQRIREIEREWRDDVADANGRRVYEAYDGRVRFGLPHPLEGSLYLLEAGSLFIFLTGGFNVMVLVLHRLNGKRHELSIRQALGARRADLRRLLLAESLLLVGAASVVGVGMAAAGTAGFNRYVAVLSPQTMPVALNAAVAVATVAAALPVVCLVHLVPLEALSRAGWLQRVDGSQRTASGSRAATRLSGALVIGQVAAAFVMLIAAGLLLNSLRSVLGVDPGFDADRIVEGRLDFETVQASYPSRAEAGVLKRRIHDAMAEIPGVESVAFSMFRMFGHDLRSGGRNFFSSGAPGAPPVGEVIHYVSPGFFTTMGMPVLAGRGCAATDEPGSVTVDALFARRTFGERNPVGLEIPGSGGAPPRRVTGVVGRANLRGLEQRDGQPILYICEPIDRGWWEYSILVRTARPADGVVLDMRQRLREIDPRLPLSYAGSLQAALGEMLVGRGVVTVSLASLAALALLLTSIGVYAVLAAGVVDRRREIRIRLALGARRAEVYRLVLSSGLAQTLVGLGVGGAGAVVLSRFLERFLFDVRPTDPWTYLAAALLFLAVAAAACVVPARRAVGIDPVESLRAE